MLNQYVFCKNHLLLCHALLSELIDIEADMERRLAPCSLAPDQHKKIMVYLRMMKGAPSAEWGTRDAWLIATIVSYFIAMMDEYHAQLHECLKELSWRMKNEKRSGEMDEEQYMNIRRTNFETGAIIDALRNQEDYNLFINDDMNSVITLRKK